MAFSFGKKKYKNPLDIDVYTDVNVYSSTCNCGKDDYVFNFDNKPTNGLTTYTTGKSFRWHGYDLDLRLVTSSEDKDLHLPGTMNMLITYFMDEYPNDIKYGGMTKNLGSINVKSPEMVAFYIMHTNVFNNKVVDDEFMQIMPISVKEMKYVTIYGGEALEKYFTDNNVDIFNFTRGCSMPDIHLTYDDIPIIEEMDAEGNPVGNDCIVYTSEEYGEVVINIEKNIPLEGVTTYSCDDFTNVNPLKFKKNAIMLSSNEYSDNAFPIILIAACDFFWKHPDLFEEGKSTPSIGPITDGSMLTAFYVSHLHGFSSLSLNREYLMLIPISEAEVIFLEENGQEKFEEHLFGSKIDLFDFNRKSSL